MSTSAEKPQRLLVTLHYLEAHRCKPDGDLCIPFPCDQYPECRPMPKLGEEPPVKEGLPVLRLASLSPLARSSGASASASSTTCPTVPLPPGALQFCIDATKEGNTAVIRFDRPNLLHSAGLLGLTYTTLRDGKNGDDEACLQTLAGPAEPYIKLFDKHRVSFDVGTLFTLNGDGSWDNNAEAAATFRSRWYREFLSEVTFRRSAIGAVDEGSTAESDGDGSAESDPKVFNPLAEGAGLFEANVAAVISPFWGKAAPRLGLTLGAGFSSVQGDTGSSLETRRRYYCAVRTEVEGWNSGRLHDTLAGASSWFQVGLGWDDLFKTVTVESATDSAAAVLGDESKRYFLEGEIELPKVGTEWLRILVRTYASIPRSGRGPSDIRVAALASVNPRKWFPGLGTPKPGY